MERLENIRKANAAAAAAAAPVEPQKEECTFDEFGKMDIRTATVLEAERVPKTDKLLKLTIDTGIDRRVIVSGIAEYYTPEQMVGKQICILANLAPHRVQGHDPDGQAAGRQDAYRGSRGETLQRSDRRLDGVSQRIDFVVRFVL